ncbi:hypothetical protein FB45DRAFT_872039 [Roridomyces roridus]|uniref:Uncharacterized protein n=1 Tax=Roridomyces roridus TaxID=1738132 RepID=A0AAD7FGG3_9AGAR|nr:hypothetical protein FB45DRAFT_872039 [Roridomyces roridus]
MVSFWKYFDDGFWDANGASLTLAQTPVISQDSCTSTSTNSVGTSMQWHSPFACLQPVRRSNGPEEQQRIKMGGSGCIDVTLKKDVASPLLAPTLPLKLLHSSTHPPRSNTAPRVVPRGARFGTAMSRLVIYHLRTAVSPPEAQNAQKDGGCKRSSNKELRIPAQVQPHTVEYEAIDYYGGPEHRTLKHDANARLPLSISCSEIGPLDLPSRQQSRRPSEHTTTTYDNLFHSYLKFWNFTYVCPKFAITFLPTNAIGCSVCTPLRAALDCNFTSQHLFEVQLVLNNFVPDPTTRVKLAWGGLNRSSPKDGLLNETEY